MNKSVFVKRYYSFAKASEKKTGIPAVATLAQGALESAWGDVAPGNMIFGVKDTDGVNGNEQLIVTTEYSVYANLHFPQIISITPVIRNGRKMFKYVVKDYFRKYATPEESFTDHSNFFLRNKRYAQALRVTADPYRFIDEIALAGYASDPNYASTLKSIARNIEKEIQLQKLAA